MLSTPDLAHKPLGRVVVLVGDALFEGNDGVVGDVYIDRADFGAALGDVAEAEAVLLFELSEALRLVHRVHLEPLVPDEETRARELGVLVVRAQNVADVLAHKALDAPLRLVEALDVLFVHREGRLLARGEWRDPLGHLVVPRDIRDQILYDWEGPHGVDPDLVPIVFLDARLAHQL